jgi:outer membrane protein assembly factor BamB
MRRISRSQRWSMVVAAALMPLAACGSEGPSGTVSSEQPCNETELPAVGALDGATGEVRWLVCSSAEVWRSIVGAADDVVYVVESGDNNGTRTVALSAADGSELWRTPTGQGVGDIPRGPAAGGGVVVRIGDAQTGVVGIDALSGAERWRAESAVQVLGQSETVAVVARADPSTGAPSGVVALDRVTGEEVWKSSVRFQDSSGVGVERGPAAVWEDTIALPTDRTLTALDMASGTKRWTAPQTDHPEAADGVVVGAVPSTGPRPRIRALDAGTGAVLWEASGRSSYGDLVAVGDGIVAVTAVETPEVVAYDLRTGDERWRVGGPELGQPQLVVGHTLVLLWEGTLSAVSTSDGATLWSARLPLGSPLMNSVGVEISMESLILAQDERWRRA